MCWWWCWGDKGHLQLFIELPFLGLLLFLLIDAGLVKERDIVFASILEVNWIWKQCVCFISVFIQTWFFLFDTKRMSSHLKIVQLVKFSLSAVLSCHLRHGFAYFPTLFYHFFRYFSPCFYQTYLILSPCFCRDDGCLLFGVAALLWTGVCSRSPALRHAHCSVSSSSPS